MRMVYSLLPTKWWRLEPVLERSHWRQSEWSSEAWFNHLLAIGEPIKSMERYSTSTIENDQWKTLSPKTR